VAVPDMFGNFYSVESHKIVNKSEITVSRKKISTDFGILRITENF
jgi:hypothetical protein